MLSPPVLLVSMAHSGSNWVADSLALSPTAAYLREPLTRSQSPSRKNKRRSNLFEFPIDQPPPEYVKAARLAFAGVPRFPSRIVRYKSQWRSRERGQRRVLIKELNPLALPWLLSEHQPRVVFLIRHPVGMAREIEASGWSGWSMRDRFLPETLAEFADQVVQYDTEFWGKQGALQGILHVRVQQALAGYADHRILKYEDLCAAPMDGFRELFDYCQLQWTDLVEEALFERLARPTPFGGVDTDFAKSSLEIAFRWRNHVSGADQARVREAYEAVGGAYYGEADW
jgi:hypothetical protein